LDDHFEIKILSLVTKIKPMKKGIFSLLIFVILAGCITEEQIGTLSIPEGSPAFFQSDIPQPYFSKHQHLEDLYWVAWNILYKKVSYGTTENSFEAEYLDEGFNELIYQWDTCFMALFAVYGGDNFAAMASLDNFYKKQETDGWISRVYRESDGLPVEQPTIEEPMINPPLFAWVEWKYYLITGDSSRFSKILPILDKYYDWIDQNCRGVSSQAPLYYNTRLGSGMDNSPREGIPMGGWIDLSAQMALFAKYMLLISGETGDEMLVGKYSGKYQNCVRIINSYMWDNSDNFYYDINSEGQKMGVKTAATFWTLLAEVASFPQAQHLVRHLQDSTTFYRQHLFPTLAANHPEFDGNGHYWRGGVWAPINYMIIKGLEMYPYKELAMLASLNHLDNIYEIYANFSPDEQKIAPPERDGSYKTIWESYAPDFKKPATRWDGDCPGFGKYNWTATCCPGEFSLLESEINRIAWCFQLPFWKEYY
jgi:glycogen debranching enzyme